jgi:hypothetical protein
LVNSSSTSAPMLTAAIRFLDIAVITLIFTALT